MMMIRYECGRAGKWVDGQAIEGKQCHENGSIFEGKFRDNQPWEGVMTNFAFDGSPNLYRGATVQVEHEVDLPKRCLSCDVDEEDATTYFEHYTCEFCDVGICSHCR